MEDNILKHGMRFLLKQKRRKRWQKVVGFLACLVVFCTSYALILPAITMEATAYCGKEEHVHDDSCYETSKTLICGLEEQTETAAAENLAETASGESETQETETIGAAHVHTEECYQYEKVLACTLEEHTHTQECYSDKNADVETASDWENTLPALTGKRAADLILVAESQIGYRESGINYEVVGTDTLKGYTRYGAWYGQPYGDWSGMFAAFCLNYAGIPQSIFPYDADCQQWADILAQRGMYAATGSYTPKAGDIAFLDTDGTPGIERVGIIRDVSEEGAITTIEGDAQDAVQYGNYTLNSENVKGYGILPEEDTPETTGEETSQATPEEDAKMLEADGEDYKITVTYDESAGIPDGAILKVSEYSQDSEEYATRFEQANTVLLEQDGSCIRRARFFNISIMDRETEIEPESTVKVEISQSSEITEADGDIVITHATDEGTEVISEVEQTEENGYVTTSFETESFSDYGTISAGGSITVGVGDTVTLKGTASKGGTVNEWTLSSVGVVTIEQSGTNDATITGATVGTVTITHKYSTNKNKTATETFTVTVTDNGGSGGDDTGEETEKEAAGTGYTVTVKGNKKILENAELIVEEISPEKNVDYYSQMVKDIDSTLSTSVSDKDEVFNFLKMYHIYLSKDGGETEYDPAEDTSLSNVNINLQVTITYDDTPEGWTTGNGNLYVGHYKKNTSGKVENKGFVDSTGIKQIKVSGNSITFHIQGFSVITAAAPAKTLSTPIVVTPGADGTYGASLEQTAKNSWQIVSGGYNGNAEGNKTLSDDNLVRVQKNMVPTDVENEFLIYLSIDKKVSWEEIIQSSNLVLTSSGSYKKIGEMYESIHGNSDEISPVDSGTDENAYTATVTLTRNGNAVQTITQIYYGTVPNCSNATGFLKLTINGKTKYVTASTSVNLHEDGSGSGGALTYTIPLESLQEGFDFADFTVSYDGVSDTMGEYIELDSTFTPTGDYSTAPGYRSDTKTLSWQPVQKRGLLPIYTDNETKVTGWYLNSAELVYKVKLDVSKEGFKSSAQYLTSNDENEDFPYATNASASLLYHWTGEAANVRTTNFTSPEVRGLLYDVVFNKVDAEDKTKGVEGAEFTLTDSSGNVKGSITTTDEQTQYEIASGLPYGTYTLTETLPSGYSAVNGTRWTVQLSYTDVPGSLSQCEVHSANMRNAENGEVLTIENKKEEIEIVLKKADMNDSPLSGATFKLYDENGQELEKGLIASGTDGIFTPDLFKLEAGTYYLEETKAPEGYYMPDGRFKLVVTSVNVSVYNYDSSTEGNYKDSPTKTFNVESNKAEVSIYNSTGVELPATGGAGILPYTFGGLGLILASGLMYGYSMRRRRERRSR